MFDGRLLFLGPFEISVYLERSLRCLERMDGPVSIGWSWPYRIRSGTSNGSLSNGSLL